MEAASVTAGKRLLDTLDVHWYPEAQDGANHRILDNSINTTAMYNARMQAPRSLWDYDYHEISWIEQWNGQWLPILPPLQASIDNYYHDTNLAITEYDYGGQNHYSGGIATTDVLGIFGKYGVYIGTYWGDGSYVKSAFKLYTNYNGWKDTFGDTNIPATTTNKIDSSIYASIFTGDANELHLIVLNKNISNAINGTFNITSTKNYTIGRVWAFDGNSPNVTPLAGTITVTGNSFTYSVSPKTANHIVLWESCPYTNEITGDCRADMTDFDLLISQWLNTGDCSADPDCADLNGDNIVDFLDFALLVEDWLK
jgi:hypothetical protein